MLATTHFTDPATIATFVVAGVTLFLVLVTYRQVHASRRAFDLSIRPFLAEVPYRSHADTENVQFGAPGRDSIPLADNEFYLEGDDARFQFSVSFRNVGGGAAVITGVNVVPDAPGDCVYSRKIVPPGEHVRVNKSIHMGLPESEALLRTWQTSLGVTVEYCDVNGGQAMASTAQIREYATHGAFVQWIEVYRITRAVFRRPKRELLVRSGHSAA